MMSSLRLGWQDRHQRHKLLLSLLLPWLAATEFLENSSFLFASGLIAHGLGAGTSEFVGVLAAFATGSMVMVALQQTLASRFGYRRYLLGALALFQLGALGSLWTSSIDALTISRAVQGLGSGALFTSGRILIPLLFASAERGPTLRRFIRWLFCLSAFGPALASGVISTFGWRAAFAVPLPLSIVCSGLIWFALPDGVGQHEQPPWRFQWWAVCWLIVAIALLQIGLAEARYPQQFTLQQFAEPVALAALILGGWWWRQVHRQAPLIHWRNLNHPGYLVGLSLYGLYYLMSNASGVVLPVFAERVLALPTSMVGLLGTGGALVGWLAASAYLRWGSRSGIKPALMAGAAGVMGLAFIGLACLPSDRLLIATLIASVAAKGVFSALFVLPLAGLAFRELGDDHFGAGYQFKNLLRHLMISVGIALAALGLAQGTHSAEALPQACDHLFVVLAVGYLLLMAWVSFQKRLR